MIDNLLRYLLEGSICIALGLVFYKAFLQKLTFFDWNRAVLLLMLVLGVTIPLFSFEFGTGQATIREFTLPEYWVGKSTSAAVQQGFTVPEMIIFIYALGLAISLCRLILGLLKPIFQLQLVDKIPYGGMTLAVHPSFEPASFFNYILLPEFNPEDPDQRQILLHESVHIEKKHTWDLMLMQFVKAVFWFNPLIYLYESSLLEVHEYQADQGVTKAYSQIGYSRLLLKLIAKNSGWQFVHSFNQFQTKKRIMMMNKPQSRSILKSRFLLAIPVVAMMLFVFACEESDEGLIAGEADPRSMGSGNSVAADPAASTIHLAADGQPIFDVVETQPNPPGGMKGWNGYLKDNLRYPEQAKTNGIQGTVIAVFVIGSDGSISDVEILRGIGGGCDEEAIRVIENSPHWAPGKQNGTNINTRMRLPIRFKLDATS